MKIAILSDIHSNFYALESVLQHALQQQCDKYVFLGDLLGDGPNPIEVIEKVKIFTESVAGNHDQLYLDLIRWLKATDEPLVKETLQRLKDDSYDISLEISENLTEIANTIKEKFPNLSVNNGFGINSMLRNIVQLMACDEEREHYFNRMNQEGTGELCGPKLITIDNVNIIMVHGSLNNPCIDTVLPDNKVFLKEALLELGLKQGNKNGQYCLCCGHSHIHMYLKFDFDEQIDGDWDPLLLSYNTPLDLGKRLTVINPGSVGKPRDENPCASYAIIDTNDFKVTYHRVQYPIEKTITNMRRLFYPEGLREQLKEATFPHDLSDESKLKLKNLSKINSS